MLSCSEVAAHSKDIAQGIFRMIATGTKEPTCSFPGGADNVNPMGPGLVVNVCLKNGKM
jgi:hypothetical protein